MQEIKIRRACNCVVIKDKQFFQGNFINLGHIVMEPQENIDTIQSNMNTKLSQSLAQT